MDCVWIDDEGLKRLVIKLVLCWIFDKVFFILFVLNVLIGDNLDFFEIENRIDVDFVKFKVNEFFVVEIFCNEDRKFFLDIDICWFFSLKLDFDEEIIVDFKGGWVIIEKFEILFVIFDLDNDWVWELIFEFRGVEVDIEEKSFELGLIFIFVEIFVFVEVLLEGINGIKFVEYLEFLEVWVLGKKLVENEEILFGIYIILFVFCWFIIFDDRIIDLEFIDDLVKVEGDDCIFVIDGDKNVVDKGRVDVNGFVFIILLEDSIVIWELGCRVEFELFLINFIDEMNCDIFDWCRFVDVLFG